MPELPEVETIVRSLRARLEGARLGAVWTSGLPLRMARPLDAALLARICRGARIEQVSRRGKYILLAMRTGRRRGSVLVHLGMSGRLRVHGAQDPREKHTHVVWSLDGNRELRFVDPRRFGLVRAAAAGDGLPELAGLGPDPLADLDEAGLALALGGSRAPVKAFLLDQRRVAGLGNIYVCEALFRASVHPATPACRLRRRSAALVQGIRQALALGIANRGTTLRDYVDGEGGAGTNQAALMVYGRGGQPCRVCHTAVRRRVDAQRSTFYCPRCQKR
jgi:formamidopyrimidine-DNA glycosylase